MSPGAMLVAGREAAGMDVAELARITRIPRETLERLEQDAWHLLPAVAYLRGFIRAYCREVGLDPALPVAVLDAQIAASTARQELASAWSVKMAHKRRIDAVRFRGAYVAAVATLIALIFAVLFSLSPTLLEARDSDASAPPPSSSWPPR